MSIENTSDFPLTGNEVGADLWPLLNRFEAAVVSNYANSSRPPEMLDGGLYSKENSNGTHTLTMFSRGKDVSLLSTTTAGAISSGYFYTKTQVDNLIAAVEADLAEVGQVPIGGIIMWSGSTTAIPSGWALCNGSNGTPNLRDRFIVGAGQTYSVGANGGSDVLTEVPKHSHTFSGSTTTDGKHDHGGKTAYDGSHNHQWIAQDGVVNAGNISIEQESDIGSRFYNSSGSLAYSNNFDSIKQNFYTGVPRSLDGSGNHRHDISDGGDHDHDYSGTTSAVGSSSIDIRPRYYALAFIMRKS